MKHILPATVALSALATPLLAQSVTELDEISVSASLTETPVARTGASVEIIDAEVLANPNTSLVRELGNLPGVSFSANGGLGAAANLRIRGLARSYIGVRIDGIDVTDPSLLQTGLDFGLLNSTGLGRIEVLKGSQSAIYGTNAIGGIVDVSTWRPDRDGLSGNLSAEAGSFGTYKTQLSFGLRDARSEFALSLGRITSDGISVRAGNSEKDGFDETSVNLSARYALTDMVTIGATALYRDSDTEYDSSVTNSAGRNLAEQKAGAVFAEILAFGMDHKLSYSMFEIERRDPTGFINFFKGERRQLSYLGTAYLDLGELTVGLEHTEEAFVSGADKGDISVTSAFSELKTAPRADLDLSVALRYDEHSEFGGKATGRIAAVWRASDDWTLRAVLGTGFRAPSLFERYSAFGSTELSPETSRSFELGAERSLGVAGTLRATAFYTEIDNKIGFDSASTACSSGFGCYNQVSGTTRSKGLEIAGRYMLSDIYTVYGNYTLTDARDENGRLAYVPRHDLVLGLDASVSARLSAGIAMQRVADVRGSAFDPADSKVGDYTLVNLSVAYDLTPGATAYLRVENLLDRDYETAGGFNQPGRAAYFGLRASF